MSKLNKNQKTLTISFFKKEYSTTCPHTDTSNNSYINNIIIDVDKKLNTDNQRSSHPLTDNNKARYTERKKQLKIAEVTKIEYITGNNFTGYTEKKKPLKKTNEPLSQGKLGARKINFINKDAEKEKQQRVLNTDQTDNLIQNKTRTASLDFYVEDFWKNALHTIYNNAFLTHTQVTKAKELLVDWYKPVNENYLPKLHSIYLERLKLVQKYLEKDPENRFVQLPYLYFDPKNKHGFTGTKIWYENYMRNKQRTKLKLITHLQIRRFLNNEQKQTTHQKPRLPLFKDCEKTIQQLGQPALLKQFYKAVLNQKNENVY